MEGDKEADAAAIENHGKKLLDNPLNVNSLLPILKQLTLVCATLEAGDPLSQARLYQYLYIHACARAFVSDLEAFNFSQSLSFYNLGRFLL